MEILAVVTHILSQDIHELSSSRDMTLKFVLMVWTRVLGSPNGVTFVKFTLVIYMEERFPSVIGDKAFCFALSGSFWKRAWHTIIAI